MSISTAERIRRVDHDLSGQRVADLIGEQVVDRGVRHREHDLVCRCRGGGAGVHARGDGGTLDRTDDDPRLVELADKLAAHRTRMADERGENYVDDTDIEPPLVKLMDTLACDTVPTAVHLGRRDDAEPRRVS
ncbi:hypothetical protein [Micromonospora sp. KC213]|uniref:hypothetical protein n=1 Tax=Micromonospora sp. KC213 TaxID=2530378 RepID=UPI001FB585C7|nr:hypothetical protein [Micromonospora sp. KC213]